ncbi:hypothetical protein ACIQ6K_07110 [Streptomyces sp. NPDC096354]|uniref:hypothetical protein n=1 Tax=Streptomyces sp. NPDC096354 TaxID=3366088 RepID=UPI003829F6FF
MLGDVEFTRLAAAPEVAHPDGFADPDPYGMQLTPRGIVRQHAELAARHRLAGPAASEQEGFHRHDEDQGQGHGGAEQSGTAERPGDEGGTSHGRP